MAIEFEAEVDLSKVRAAIDKLESDVKSKPIVVAASASATGGVNPPGTIATPGSAAPNAAAILAQLPVGGQTLNITNPAWAAAIAAQAGATASTAGAAVMAQVAPRSARPYDLVGDSAYSMVNTPYDLAPLKSRPERFNTPYSSGNYWSNVSALADPGAGVDQPDPNWRQSDGSPEDKPKPKPARPQRDQFAGLRQYIAPAFVAHELMRVASATVEMRQEERLAVGDRGQTDLMRQYKAEVQFVNNIAGIPVVGQAAALSADDIASSMFGIIPRTGPGARESAAATLQASERQDRQTELRHQGMLANRASGFEAYAAEGQGSYSRAVRSAETQLWDRQFANRDRQAAMHAAGISDDFSSKWAAQADTNVVRVFNQQSAILLTERNASIGHLRAGARSALLRGAGYDDAAAMNDVHADFEERILNEQDPEKKAALVMGQSAALTGLSRRTARERGYAAADVRAQSDVTQALIGRDPLLARIRGINATEDAQLRDKELTSEQRDAVIQASARERVLVRQEDSDQKRYLGMSLTAENRGLQFAADYRPLAGAATTAADLAQLRALELVEQHKDPANANLVLQNAILDQKARVRTYLESFDAEQFDPTLRAINSPRRGEDDTRYLAQIAENTRNLQAATTD
jgi:hypothetical protein